MYYHYQVLAIVFGFWSEGDLELKKSGCESLALPVLQSRTSCTAPHDKSITYGGYLFSLTLYDRI